MRYLRKAGMILCFVLSAILVFSLCACGDGGTYAIAYNDGTADGEYNTDLYMSNKDMTVFAADPGCIYVSEEEDPVNGGWFYMYTTGQEKGDPSADYKLYAIRCYRSKDLSRWEMVGKAGYGYSVAIEQDSWISTNCWAPEVVYDQASGTYYMYFTATCAVDDSENGMYVGTSYIVVATSTDPCGPFKVVRKDGENMPIFRFSQEYGLTQENYSAAAYGFGVIDVHHFTASDGQMYLYFVRENHTTVEYGYQNGSVWGVKLNDYLTADYDSIAMLLEASVESVTGEAGDPKSWHAVGEVVKNGDEGNVNEAPWVVEHEGRFYLLYSINGFTSAYYDVKQAVSDDPLGTFTKLDNVYGNPAIGKQNNSTFISGVGHNSIVKAGDELWSVAHAHVNPTSWDAGYGRAIVADRVNFIYSEYYGYDILSCNGPSVSLNPLPEVASDYQNVIGGATVGAKSAQDGTLQYLTDGVIPSQEYMSGMHCVLSGSRTVTIEFAEPEEICSLLLYNSIDYESAFSGISSVRFTLAESPSWQPDMKTAYIGSVAFPESYIDRTNEIVAAGGNLVLEFQPMKVSRIEIVFSESISGGGEISLSEIVALGRV